MMSQRELFEKWVDTAINPESKSLQFVTREIAWAAWQAAIAAQWQPIETAPKDGTEIIVLTDIGENFVAYFGTATKKWHEVFADNSISERATHWMPLPPEPTK